jgi:AcrR family transcriptional regulator
LKARARRWEDIRKRITKAAVHLHETVGPARTTINAIAKHAGVQRATVYNHFPTELELIDACSAHWFAENPPPDQTAWLQIQNPGIRTRCALQDMYEYYDRSRDMLGKVLRDAAVVPAMDEIRRMKWVPQLEGIVDILADGFSAPAKQTVESHLSELVEDNISAADGRHTTEKEIRACLRVVLDFFTWQTLAESGLTSADAATLAARWVEAAGESRPE